MISTRFILVGLVAIISGCTSNSLRDRVPASVSGVDGENNLCFHAAKKCLSPEFGIS
jgi:hypothetical protein